MTNKGEDMSFFIGTILTILVANDLFANQSIDEVLFNFSHKYYQGDGKCSARIIRPSRSRDLKITYLDKDNLDCSYAGFTELFNCEKYQGEYICIHEKNGTLSLELDPTGYRFNYLTFDNFGNQISSKKFAQYSPRSETNCYGAICRRDYIQYRSSVSGHMFLAKVKKVYSDGFIKLESYARHREFDSVYYLFKRTNVFRKLTYFKVELRRGLHRGLGKNQLVRFPQCKLGRIKTFFKDFALVLTEGNGPNANQACQDNVAHLVPYYHIFLP